VKKKGRNGRIRKAGKNVRKGYENMVKMEIMMKNMIIMIIMTIFKIIIKIIAYKPMVWHRFISLVRIRQEIR